MKNIRDILRNLATNCYIANFNYGTQFRFQTVHYKSTYSYCMCQCGFENEFIGYIADDGSINEDVFEKTVKSMTDGKCPHVTCNVPQDWIRRTSVSAAHIAVASGTKLTCKAARLVCLSDFKGQGIFNLELYAIALLKNKFEIVSYYFKIYMEYFKLETDNSIVLFYSKLENSPDSVVIRTVPRMIAIVQTGNHELLEYLLKPKLYSWGSIALKSSHIEEALQYTRQHNQTEAYDTLLKSEILDYSGYGKYVMKHLWTLTMYDQADTLAYFLEYRRPTKFLLLPCYVLERPKCKKILSQFMYQKPDETKHLTGKAKTDLLINLLGLFFDEFKDEILTALKKIPNYHDECKEWLLAHIYGLQLKPKVLETLLGLTLSTENDADNELFVEKLLKMLLLFHGLPFRNSWTREKLKLLLKLNTSTEYLKEHIAATVERNDIRDGLELNKNNKQFKQENFEEVYQLDAKEHGVFGYDGDEFALNFARPFLLESGVSIPRTTLEVNMGNGHPAESAYILNYIQSLHEPKCLAILCRDTLKQHFQGQKLHMFLEMTVCPNKIKEYVLMNYSLKPNSRVSYEKNHVMRQPVFGVSDHETSYALSADPGYIIINESHREKSNNV